MMWEGINQRKFPRVAYSCRIRIFKDGHEEDYDAMTENIGAGGICVVLTKQFELFDKVSLELHLDESKVIKSTGNVVWVVKNHPFKAGDAFSYDTGIEFADISEDDRALIEQKVTELL